MFANRGLFWITVEDWAKHVVRHSAKIENTERLGMIPHWYLHSPSRWHLHSPSVCLRYRSESSSNRTKLRTNEPERWVTGGFVSSCGRRADGEAARGEPTPLYLASWSLSTRSADTWGRILRQRSFRNENKRQRDEGLDYTSSGIRFSSLRVEAALAAAAATPLLTRQR